MQLDKIITLANRPVRLRVLALERSLRATGCDLPLHVIPYNDDRFDLPAHSSWWEMPSLLAWLRQEKAHPMMYKYQCLTVGNYQYVDSDVVFLRNPATVLAPETGFIASCGHWHNPGDATTKESIPLLRARSTCWQRNIFNAGQFACDRALFTEEELRATCSDPRYIATCLRYAYHDQPGLVLLTHLSGVPVHNLTLPPACMESTWAGDYPDEDFTSTWQDDARKPYLIHWAGCDMNSGRPIDRLVTDFLTQAEQAEWRGEVAAKARRQETARRSPMNQLRRLARGARAFKAALGS
jgi:hypothetical protein